MTPDEVVTSLLCRLRRHAFFFSCHAAQSSGPYGTDLLAMIE